MPGLFTVTVLSPELLHVLLSVTLTLYLPATLVLKLATLPGSVDPVGTVHLYVVTVAPAWRVTVALTSTAVPSQVSGLFTATFGNAFTVTVPSPDLLHVLLSVTTTVYLPATLVLKLATSPGSEPSGQVHLHLAVAPVWRVMVAVTSTAVPSQVRGLFTATFGNAFTVTVPSPELLHVLLSVTTTVYLPATLVLKLATSPGSEPSGQVHLHLAVAPVWRVMVA